MKDEISITGEKPSVIKKPVLQLPINRVICARHGEPFRTNWPMGYPAFALWGLQLMAFDDVLFKKAGGIVDNLTGLLIQQPICCWLTKPDLERLYRAVHDVYPEKFLAVAECDMCNKTGLGGPYMARLHRNNRNKVTQFNHLCVRCVIFDLETV